MNINENTLSFSKMDIRKNTERIILHHADSSNCSVEEIHSWHINRGWCGIGYHFFIKKDGTVYRGRPEDTVGAHSGNNNYNSIGICFEGKYEMEEMPTVQVNAGKELIEDLKKKYNISIIQKHNDVNNTICPGKNFPFDKFISSDIIKTEDTSSTNENNITQNKKTVSQVKSINIVAVKNSKVGTWQKNMNSTYSLKLVIDNCFGDDCRSKANKYCLLRGKKDNMIKWLQKKLNSKFFNCGEIDGIFGPKTLAAVLSFQKSKGLVEDGMVGAYTTIELLK